MIVPVMFSGTEGHSILYINIHDISRPQCLISLFACLLYVNTAAPVSPSPGTCKTPWAVSRNTVGRDRGTLKVYEFDFAKNIPWSSWMFFGVSKSYTPTSQVQCRNTGKNRAGRSCMCAPLLVCQKFQQF